MAVWSASANPNRWAGSRACRIVRGVALALLVGLTPCGVVSPVSASVCEVEGEVVRVAAPASVQEGEFEHDSFAHVFAERNELLLLQDIDVNAQNLFIYPSSLALEEAIVPENELVDSDYIHFDPDIKWVGTRRRIGVVDFCGEILGAIVLGADLRATPSALLSPTTTYPDLLDFEGLEFDLLTYRQNDAIALLTVGGVKRRLFFSFGTSFDIDTVRVLSRPVAPGT